MEQSENKQQSDRHNSNHIDNKIKCKCLNTPIQKQSMLD